MSVFDRLSLENCSFGLSSYESPARKIIVKSRIKKKLKKISENNIDDRDMPESGESDYKGEPVDNASEHYEDNPMGHYSDDQVSI
jgi:hypothetical protein